MEIVQAPHTVLSAIAKPVSKIDKKITSLIEEMKETLESAKDPQGVGLAAPQVGKSLELFIIKPTDNAKFSVFINPKIVRIGEPQSSSPITLTGTSLKKARRERSRTLLEGCLSLHGIWGSVVRSPQVTLYYLNEHGKPHTTTFKGFTATIVQHEMDHLIGVLFPKHVLTQGGKLYKSKKNEKGEEVFVELEI